MTHPKSEHKKKQPLVITYIFLAKKKEKKNYIIFLRKEIHTFYFNLNPRRTNNGILFFELLKWVYFTYQP